MTMPHLLVSPTDIKHGTHISGVHFFLPYFILQPSVVSNIIQARLHLNLDFKTKTTFIYDTPLKLTSVDGIGTCDLIKTINNTVYIQLYVCSIALCESGKKSLGYIDSQDTSGFLCSCPPNTHIISESKKIMPSEITDELINSSDGYCNVLVPLDMIYIIAPYIRYFLNTAQSLVHPSDGNLITHNLSVFGDKYAAFALEHIPKSKIEILNDIILIKTNEYTISISSLRSQTPHVLCVKTHNSCPILLSNDEYKKILTGLEVKYTPTNITNYYSQYLNTITKPEISKEGGKIIGISGISALSDGYIVRYNITRGKSGGISFACKILYEKTPLSISAFEGAGEYATDVYNFLLQTCWGNDIKPFFEEYFQNNRNLDNI